jgi:hypothetical protein
MKGEEEMTGFEIFTRLKQLEHDLSRTLNLYLMATNRDEKQDYLNDHDQLMAEYSRLGNAKFVEDDNDGNSRENN